ncbi:uncharacterized protein LOC135155004 [Lytechinus pictus]|uniref:uncharacterized protein LOC135155004 n=1 Tax=Lytechinus pictus TaxID=7653 RepID=UPI0030B9ECDB
MTMSISRQVALQLFLGVIISQSAPPTWIYIIDGTGVRYSFNNLSVTVIAGQQHDITCEAYGANPHAVLEWHVPDDMAVVHQDQSEALQGGSYISRKAVAITPSMNDHGKILSCITSHPELKNERLRSVHLNVHVLPRDVVLFRTGGNQSNSTVLNVQEDSPTSITCKSIRSFPATKLSFQLTSGTGHTDRIPIHENSSIKRNVLDDALFDTESTVTIHPNIKHHGKTVQCYASLEKHVVGFTSATVIVYGPPERVIMSSTVDLYDGIEINVTCRSLNGYPAPHIHWYIGSRNLTEDSSLKISENNAGRYDTESTLTLIPTRFDHGKRLLCLAVQPTRSVNQSLVLNVTYNPAVSITARRLTSHKASGTTELVLICEADANPPVNTFVWLCNETVVPWDTNNITLPQTISEDATLRSSVFAIQNQLSKNHCVFNCTAESEYGSGSATFDSLYSYVIPNPPSVFIIYQHQTRSSSLFVAWQLGFIIGQKYQSESIDNVINKHEIDPPNVIVIIDDTGIRYCFNNLSVTVIAGDQYNITCEVYGAMPPALLKWRLPDDMAVVHQDQSDALQGGFYISRKAVTITPSREDHETILNCIASHPGLQNKLLCSVHLIVHGMDFLFVIFFREYQ